MQDSGHGLQRISLSGHTGVYWWLEASLVWTIVKNRQEERNRQKWRKGAQRLHQSWEVGGAFRSPLLAETSDERTLPFSLSNG